MKSIVLPVLFALTGAVAAIPARADSWALPKATQVSSPDGKARARIVPRDLESQLAYFTEAGEHKARPGQARGGNSQARARVEVQAADGAWTLRWEGPLANDVAPVDVLVADGGRNVVTFDNWHSVGYGKDAVVLYDATGRIVRQWGLADFLGKRYVLGLPHSVSSIEWRGKPRLSADGSRAEIDVVVPADDPEAEPSRFVVFDLSLADATLRPRDPAQWASALLAGEKAAAAVDAARQKWLDELAAPFPSPVGKDEEAWRQYERELERRLDVRLDGYINSFILLPAKDDPDYAEELSYVEGFARYMTKVSRQERERGYANVVYASVEPHDMYQRLLPAVRAAPAGAWVGARLIYAGEAEHDAELREAIERTGATYLFVDIAQPLPGEHPRLEPEDE
jgi:hypothetical protein